jgi:enamine deaminase RidA (YjgF/YER057c/UK114 family)
MPLERRTVQTNAPWESIVGYSRAVRVGQQIAVTGTTALDENGKLVGIGDPGAQAERCFANIESALKKLGATRADVIRTRIYVTNIAQWEPIGRAHGRFFGDVRPATTLVQVSALIDPKMLVEVEADAIVAG